MSQFLFYYQRPEPATWVYMSSFLIIALYFMFHRLWSVRNLDILLVILLTPGLMLVYEGRKAKSQADLGGSSGVESAAEAASLIPKLASPAMANQEVANQEVASQAKAGAESRSEARSAAKGFGDTGWSGDQLQFYGFAWLLAICGFWLVRLLLDTAMVRRPLLEPNLSSGGTTFIGISLFLFLMANVLTSPTVYQLKTGIKPGPGYELLKVLPDIQTSPSPDFAESSAASPGGEATVPAMAAAPAKGMEETEPRIVVLSRLLLIVANLILVLGIVAIGYWHFENLKTGIGVATLFLLLPYTAQMTGRLDHLAPGALIVLAVAFYRQPWVAGIMLGGAAGLVFFPFFLVPLWLSFYWLRGRKRFVAGFVTSVIGMVAGLMVASQDGFWSRLGQMFGTIPFAMEKLDGIWAPYGWHPYFRVPVMVIFVVLSLSFVFWPAQKSLATLLSCSAAIMTASQFCYAYGGGLYMAWFLPCTLLTVFRPNLDDCIALDVVRSWSRTKPIPKASDSGAESSYAEAG
jgi:hypothetical protein